MRLSLRKPVHRNAFLQVRHYCFNFRKLQKSPFADVLQSRCTEKFRSIHGKYLHWDFFLKVFSWEYYKVFKSSYTEHLWLLLLNSKILPWELTSFWKKYSSKFVEIYGENRRQCHFCKDGGYIVSLRLWQNCIPLWIISWKFSEIFLTAF